MSLRCVRKTRVNLAEWDGGLEVKAVEGGGEQTLWSCVGQGEDLAFILSQYSQHPEGIDEAR